MTVCTVSSLLVCVCVCSQWFTVVCDCMYSQSMVYCSLLVCDCVFALASIQLVPGVYTLRLKVTNWMGSDWGEGFINITVHEASHVNSPPVPVILPSSDEMVRTHTQYKHLHQSSFCKYFF